MSDKKTVVSIDLKSSGIFRPAKSTDVFEGNTVFLVGDRSRLIKMTVEEVINPTSEFKAFTFDGCRYGLDGLYVLLKDGELHSKIIVLQNKLSSIKEILE